MEPDDVVGFAAATHKLKKDPSLLSRSELGFFKDFLATLGVPFTVEGVPAVLPAVQNAPTARTVPVEPPTPATQAEAAAAALPAAPAASAVPAPLAPGEVVEIDLLDDDDEGAKDTSSTTAPPPPQETSQNDAAVDVADSDEEDTQRLEADQGPFPPLPEPIDAEPTEAQIEACAAAKQAAAEAIEDGDAKVAMARYTEAILTGAASALLYARRAELLLRQQRPCAAIADCTAALQVNPDCGKAHRLRGIAQRRLGQWEAAHQDLSLGQKLDFDEASVEVQKYVAKKVKQIEERRAQRLARAPPAKKARV